MLDLEQILTTSDLDKQAVDVPEWGGSVYVRRMRGDELYDYHDKRKALLELGPITAVLAAYTLCDEQGNLLCQNKEEAVPKLAQKSGVALERIAKIAIADNFLNDKAKEDHEKNS